MQDLVIELRNDGTRLYQQIYAHIRDEIREGKLLYREKLPSTRSLAEYLQVSRSTVELAYEQLLAEGYLESVPYKGYYVAQVEELYRIEVGKGRKAEEKAGARPRYRVDFSPNAIDMRQFPFGVWRRISRNILSQDNQETFLPGDARGDRELRETIGRYLHASRGVNCTADQIVVGAGNDYLLLLLRFLLGEGRHVVFENPTYPRAYKIFGLYAGSLRTVASDENGIRVDLLPEETDTVYVMPSHQYPTGVIMPIGRRLELLKWTAQKPGRYVVEDDYDSEFRYRGKPIPSLQASDRLGRVIYIGTFSKAIAPAIRVSYMVLPPELLELYERRCGIFSSTVSRIDQAVLNEFIRDGAFERHLNRMRKVYREKHDLLLAGLEPFRRDFILSGENAGLHVLLTDKKGRREEALREAAAAEGVRVYGLSEAMVEPKDMADGQRATLLLGFGGLTGQEIVSGIGLLARAWEVQADIEPGKVDFHETGM